MSNNYLFLLTISPVQSFISKARKSRDLFAGSVLLSKLIELCLQHLNELEEEGIIEELAIIFPHISVETKPNRFLVKLKIEENRLTDLAFDFEDLIENYLLNRLKNVLKDQRSKLDEEESLIQIVEKQIKGYFKVFWCMENVNENNDYESAFLKLESNIQALKMVRSFSQNPEIGRKCSLSGEENALFINVESPSHLPAHAFTSEFIEKKQKITDRYSKTYFTPVKITPHPMHIGAEGLSALQFLKRFLGHGENFDSTAKIASLDAITLIEKEARYQSYTDFFGKKLFDEQLLFDENLTSKYFEKHGLGKVLSKEYDFLKNILDTPKITSFLNRIKKRKINNEFSAEIKNIKDFHRETILDLLKERDLQLNRYYGVLSFDGDSMGKWMRAYDIFENETDRKILDLQNYHQTFSKLLGHFAKEAKQYIDDGNLGRTIYAGGDDFLGMLNLNKIWQTVNELRLLFDRIVNRGLKKEVKDIHPDKDLTFSAGLAIAPYKMPLNKVLNLAEQSQKKAKAIDKEKNAFCIAVLKGSGESLESTLKWSFDDIETLKCYQVIQNSLKETFSSTFIHSIYQVLGIYRNPSFESEENPFNMNIVTDILKVESNRALNRAFKKERGIETIEEFNRNKRNQIEKVTNALVQLLEVSFQNGEGVDSIDAFLNCLGVIEFIERKIYQV